MLFNKKATPTQVIDGIIGEIGGKVSALQEARNSLAVECELKREYIARLEGDIQAIEATTNRAYQVEQALSKLTGGVE